MRIEAETRFKVAAHRSRCPRGHCGLHNRVWCPISCFRAAMYLTQRWWVNLLFSEFVISGVMGLILTTMVIWISTEVLHLGAASLSLWPVA